MIPNDAEIPGIGLGEDQPIMTEDMDMAEKTDEPLFTIQETETAAGDDGSRGRNDDIRSPEESFKLKEFRRRIDAEIESALGPTDLSEAEQAEIDGTVEAFVLECANASGTDEDNIKMHAADAWDEFREYLLRRLRPVFEEIIQRR